MAKKLKPIKKNIPRLIEKLIHHLKILTELSDKAFYEYKYKDYLGDVAVKLRILVVKRGMNKALLLDLMDHFKYERVFADSFGNLNSTLRTFMYDLRAMSKDKYVYDNEAIIRHLADQEGGAHEDWEIDSELFEIYEDKTRMNDSPFYYHTMRGIVNTVLEEATLFLLYLHENKILENLKVEYTFRDILSIGTTYPNEMDWSIVKRKEKGIIDSIKPFRLVERYDILWLSGKLNLLNIPIPNVTPKDELRKNGPKKHFILNK